MSSRIPRDRIPVALAWLAVTLSLGLTLWAYAPALNAGFVFDDEPNIVDSPAVHWDGVSAEDLQLLLTSSRLRRRPVANLSFALDHVVWGLEPRGFHLTNLLVHLGVGAALIWVTLLYIRNTAPSPSPENSKASLLPWVMLPVGVFLLHPLNTQAVTYVVQRMTSLAALFTLLGFGSYLMARRPTPRRRAWWLAGAFAFAALGVASKENAVLLVPVVLLYEWCFHRREWRGRVARLLGRPWDRNLSVAACVASAVVLTVAGAVGVAMSDLVGFSTDFGWRDFSGLERVITQPRVQMLYLSLLLWPSPGRLNLDHEFTISRGLLDPPVTLLATWATLLLLGTAVFLAVRRPRYGFPLLAYAVFHAIEAGPVDLELVFEHRVYLPSTMLALLGAALLVDGRPRRRVLVPALIVLLTVPLAGWTRARNEVWRDPLLLQEDIALKSPTHARAQHNYALALLEAGRVEDALPVAERTISLDQGDVRPRILLGRVLVELGRPDEAVLAYRTALSIAPNNVAAALGLGAALEGGGRVEDAFQHYLDAGVGLGRRGLPWQAIPILQEAVALQPGESRAQNALGSAYLGAGLNDRAAEQFRAAVATDSSNVEAWYNLGIAAEALGRSAEALAAYREFVDRAPPTLRQPIDRARIRIAELEFAR